MPVTPPEFNDAILVRSGDHFPVALFALDPEGRFSFWNRQFLNVLGLNDTLITADGLPEILQTACFFPAPPEPNSIVETHWRHADGSILDIEVRLSPAPKGSPHHLIGFAREISRRREAEAEVDRLSSLNELLLRANELFALEPKEDRLLRMLLDLLERRLSLPLIRFLNPWGDTGPISITPSRIAEEEPTLSALLSVLAKNGQSVLAQAFSRRTPLISDLNSGTPASPWEEALYRRGIRHLISIPVKKAGQIFLILHLASSKEQGFPKGLDQALSGLMKTLSKTLDRLSLEARSREESLIQKTLLDNSLSGVVILKDKLIQTINKPLLLMLGYECPEQILGQPVSILFYDHEEFMATGKDIYSRAPSEEAVRYTDIKARKKEGGFLWVDASATVAREDDDILVIISLQDAQLRHTQTDRLSLLARYNRFLARINALIAECSDESVLLREVCDLAIALTGLTMARISRPDPEGWLTTLAMAGDGWTPPSFRISIREERPEGQGAYGKMWRERAPVFGIDYSKVALDYPSPQREWLLSTGYRSSAFLPLFRGGEIWGILAVHASQPEVFAPELCEVLTEISRALSGGLDKIDLQSREKESAAIIRALFEKTSSGILMSQNRKIIMVNDQLVHLFGYDSPQEMTGRDSSYFYATEEEYERVGRVLYPSIIGSKDFSVPDVQARRKDGTLLWIDLYGSHLDFGDETTMIFTLTDTTARHEQAERLSRLSLFTQVLADFRRIAGSAKTDQELLEGVCRLSAEGKISDIIWIGHPDSDGWFSFDHAAGESGWLEGLRISILEEVPEGHGAAGTAWRSNEPRFNVSLETDHGQIPSSWKTIIDLRGIRTTAAVPVRKNGSLWAILAFLDRRPGAFSPELRQILIELGESLSEGLNRLSRMADQKRLASAVDAVEEGILFVSTDLKILYANPSMGEMLGRSSEDLVGESSYILVGPETDPGTVEKILEAFRTEKPFKEKILTYRQDGSSFWNLLSISPIFDDSGHVREFVGIHRNVTDIVEASRKFEYESLHDKLTGLPNKHAFDLHLRKAMARAKRFKETLALGFIDLDDFKPINDRYGHKSGDNLLREFSSRALSLIRETDFFGRLGGDEFVVVFESLGENDNGLSERLERAVERLHEAVSSSFEVAPGENVSIGMSMGIALFPNDGESEDELLRKADLTMYRTKGEKLTRAVWWSRYHAESLDREREEDFDIYGEHAIALLARYRPLFDEVTRQFATTFYDRLSTDPEAWSILESMTPERRARLVESQTKHLMLLLSPDTRPDAITQTAHALGTIHALVGVSVPLILSAKSIYSNIFFEKISRAPLSTSDRLRLLLLFENRLGNDIRGQVESYGRTIGLYSDILSTPPPPPGSPWPDILAQEISVLEKLQGIAGAILLRPDRQGGFAVESSSRISFPWESTEHLQALRSSWNENRQIRIHCTDPISRNGGEPKSWCASLFLPVRDETDRPAAILFLAGIYPHQFDSAWSGRFLSNLSRRWSELWSRSQTTPRSVEEESSRTLRKELLEGGLRIYLQPVVDLSLGTVTRVEALARLERPGGEILSPGLFLPLLGESDLIWLFREGLELAARQLSAWDRQDLFLDLSLNLPPHALADERCASWVTEPLSRHGISPSRITLELLENQRMDPRTQSEGIRRILEIGVKLSIDDLGSGYSTLERLASVPFDTIKVDQGLLFRFYSSPLETIALVGAIVDLGRDFNHHVVIEGLGHTDLVEVARHLGARYGQGFALARPMAPQEIPSFVAKFKLSAGDRAIKSTAGALAYLWRNEIRGTDRISEDPRECPLRKWLSSRETPGSLAILWHDGIHSDPENREIFLENLKAWIAKKIRMEEPESL